MVLSSSSGGLHVKRAKVTYGRTRRGPLDRTSSSLTSLPSSESDSSCTSLRQQSESGEDGDDSEDYLVGRSLQQRPVLSANPALPPWKLTKVNRKPLGEQPATIRNLQDTTKPAIGKKAHSTPQKQEKAVTVVIAQKFKPPISSPLSSPPPLPPTPSSSGSSRRSALAAQRRLKTLLCSDEEEHKILPSTRIGRVTAVRSNFVPESPPSERYEAATCASDDEVEELAVESSLANLTICQTSSLCPISCSEDEDDESSPPRDLQSLLMVCNQKRLRSFREPMSELIGLESTHDLEITSAGEASFSFVYRLSYSSPGSSSILKIIPLAHSNELSSEDADDSRSRLVGRSPCSDVLREIVMIEILNDSHQEASPFVKLIAATVVQGQLPQCFGTFISQAPSDTSKTTSSSRGAGLYALLHLSDSGTDLERFALKNWLEAAVVLAQVIEALAGAEESHQFEHRDLHWGNVLVHKRRLASRHDKSKAQSPGESGARFVRWDSLVMQQKGQVQVTIIDFTLSRIGSRGDVEYFDLSREPELFTGDASIDEQFEVYRSMRKLLLQSSNEDNGPDDKLPWSARFDPRTNILWIHYLVRKLIHEKGLGEKAARGDIDLGIDTAGKSLEGESASNEVCRQRLQKLEQLLGAQIDRYFNAQGPANGDHKQATGPLHRKRHTHARSGSRSQSIAQSPQLNSLADLRRWLEIEWK